jgi:hypothetical protein
LAAGAFFAAFLGAAGVLGVAGIWFALTVDFEGAISNAVGILSIRLTCLNHNRFNALIIIKHIGYGSG